MSTVIPITPPIIPVLTCAVQKYSPSTVVLNISAMTLMLFFKPPMYTLFCSRYIMSMCLQFVCYYTISWMISCRNAGLGEIMQPPVLNNSATFLRNRLFSVRLARWTSLNTAIPTSHLEAQISYLNSNLFIYVMACFLLICTLREKRKEMKGIWRVIINFIDQGFST